MSYDPAPDPGAFNDQAEKSTTLPADWYFDPHIYRLEQEFIFNRSWWYLCHQSVVAEPGSRYLDRIAARPVELTNHNGAIEARCDRRLLRIENYAGFWFVNFDPDAAPLIDQTSGFLQDMFECCPELGKLIPVHRFEREIAANWKTVIDNNHECYHCEANHKSLMRLVDYRDKALWSDDGITFSHKVERHQTGESAYELSADASQQESLFGYIWPTLVPLFFPGSPSLVMFQVRPLAPEKSLLRHDFLLSHREPTPQESEFIDWFVNVLNFEDVGLCESVQKGLHSRGYHQGRFIVDRDRPEYSEHHVHFFQSMVKRALSG